MFEYKIKRDNGLNIKIMLYLYSTLGNDIIFRVSDIQYCEKGKRKYQSVALEIRDDLNYRKLCWANDEQKEYIKNIYLKYVTKQEIQDAVNWVITQITPSFDQIGFTIH